MAATGSAGKTSDIVATASVSKPESASGLEFELDVSFKYVGSYTSTATDPASTDTMEMMTYLSAANATTGAAVGINFGYYTTAGTTDVHYRQTQFGTNIDYWRVYTVTASIPTSQSKSNVTYSQAEIFAAIGGSTTKFDMAATRKTSDSRAKFYVGAATKAAPTGPGNDGTASGGFKFAQNLNFTAANANIVGYLGIYVEGDGVNDSPAGVDTAPDGSFTVTISQQTGE